MPLTSPFEWNQRCGLERRDVSSMSHKGQETPPQVHSIDDYPIQPVRLVTRAPTGTRRCTCALRVNKSPRQESRALPVLPGSPHAPKRQMGRSIAATVGPLGELNCVAMRLASRDFHIFRQLGSQKLLNMLPNPTLRPD